VSPGGSDRNLKGDFEQERRGNEDGARYPGKVRYAASQAPRAHPPKVVASADRLLLRSEPVRSSVDTSPEKYPNRIGAPKRKERLEWQNT
jgi:hypothetical protein